MKLSSTNRQLSESLVLRMTGGHLVQHYLLASCAYYDLDESPMTDHAYDLLCRRLHELWDTFDHPHKKYIEREAIAEGGTGYYIREYPRQIVHGVHAYCDRIRSGELYALLDATLPI